MARECGELCITRRQGIKGRIDNPGRELYSYCSKPETMNRFCGHLPKGHDETYCHKKSEKTKRILQEMKEVIRTMDSAAPCDQWDTWTTVNNTPGPHRFNFYTPKGRPWDLNRVKSSELIGSQLFKNCDCIKRNGLQDECPRLQCRGRGWCLESPFPICPPFTRVPRPHCDLDPYTLCPEQPWKDFPGYKGPEECPIDPLLVELKENRDPCPEGTTCKVRCPNTGREYTYQVSAMDRQDLPNHMKEHSPSPVFKLTHKALDPNMCST